MLAERNCINNNSEPHLLSAQYIISCDKLDFGCNGGNLPETLSFLSEEGIPRETCLDMTYIGEPYDLCPDINCSTEVG